MAPEIIEVVTGRPHMGEPAEAEGYAVYYVKKAPFPGMVPEEKKIAQGILYQDISLDEWNTLDAYEGDFYVKKVIDVKCEAGLKKKAMAYLVSNHSLSALSSDRWTWEEFTRLHQEQYYSNLLK